MKWRMMAACALVAMAGGARAETALDGDWTVTALGERWVSSAAPEMHFDGEGRLTGRGGCNRFSGQYAHDGAGIMVEGVAATRMACPGDAMPQEEMFFRLLMQADAWRLADDGSLELSADGVTLLTARR